MIHPAVTVADPPSTSRARRQPRVHERDAEAGEVGRVARHDRETVFLGSTDNAASARTVRSSALMAGDAK